MVLMSILKMFYQKNKIKKIKVTIKLKKVMLVYTESDNICKDSGQILNNEFIYQQTFRTNSLINTPKGKIKISEFIKSKNNDFTLKGVNYICINYLKDF